MFTVFTMSDQREKILSCACDLYVRLGLDGFSMRKLARDVGVTAPAIYRHYDGRDAVLGDVLREAHRTFARYLYGALGEPTPLLRFMAAGQGFVDFVIEHPRWYGIMHTSAENLGMDELPEDIVSMETAVHQFWMDRVRECQQAEILKDGDTEGLAITMWAHAHGMAQLYRHGCFPGDEGEFRTIFRESGTRLMEGVATARFAAEVAEVPQMAGLTGSAAEGAD